jgi:hypothetical protein
MIRNQAGRLVVIGDNAAQSHRAGVEEAKVMSGPDSHKANALTSCWTNFLASYEHLRKPNSISSTQYMYYRGHIDARVLPQ